MIWKKRIIYYYHLIVFYYTKNMIKNFICDNSVHAQKLFYVFDLEL